MKITVFGANGNVGRLVVENALHQGHEVIAFIHGDNPFKASDKLSVIKGDIYNQKDVEKALNGSQAVISTLGSWGTPNKNILSAGMKNIIPKMQDAGINRIISLTGAGCNPNGS
jgi:putative NADH-flavin reductase